MWEEIATKMNSKILAKRSIQEVQKKYDKEEITNYRKEANKTGKNYFNAYVKVNLQLI